MLLCPTYAIDIVEKAAVEELEISRCYRRSQTSGAVWRGSRNEPPM
jgi:hypothetical protein